MLNNSTIKKIEKDALELLSRYDITDLPVPVARIAEEEGFRLGTASLSGEFKDIAGFVKLDTNMIILNSNDPVYRQRFTIAHELGHHILHREKLRANGDFGIVLRETSGETITPEEQEANAFAAYLLMPKRLVKKYLKDYEDMPKVKLAELIGVPIKSLIIHTKHH